MVCLTVLLQHGYVFLGIVFHVVFVFVFFVFFFRVLLLTLLFFSYFSLCASFFYSVLLVASVFVSFCYSRFWIGRCEMFPRKN